MPHGINPTNSSSASATPKPADNGSNGNNARSGTLGGVRVRQAQTANAPASPGGARLTPQNLSGVVSGMQGGAHGFNNHDIRQTNQAASQNLSGFASGTHTDGGESPVTEEKSAPKKRKRDEFETEEKAPTEVDANNSTNLTHQRNSRISAALSGGTYNMTTLNNVYGDLSRMIGNLNKSSAGEFIDSNNNLKTCMTYAESWIDQLINYSMNDFVKDHREFFVALISKEATSSVLTVNRRAAQAPMTGSDQAQARAAAREVVKSIINMAEIKPIFESDPRKTLVETGDLNAAINELRKVNDFSPEFNEYSDHNHESEMFKRFMGDAKKRLPDDCITLIRQKYYNDAMSNVVDDDDIDIFNEIEVNENVSINYLTELVDWLVLIYSEEIPSKHPPHSERSVPPARTNNDNALENNTNSDGGPPI